MAYSEDLAKRIRKAFNHLPKVEEKKMMGGLTFMVNGKMCVGVLGDDLMARIDPEIYESALSKIGAREMNFTGRVLKGFVFVGPTGVESKHDFDYWTGLAIEFNKKAKASKK